MRVQFNTGRQYGPDGQRIVAVVTHGGIFFKDHTRGIDGYIVCQMQNMSARDVEENVMLAYDRGMYVYNAGIQSLDMDWKG